MGRIAKIVSLKQITMDQFLIESIPINFFKYINFCHNYFNLLFFGVGLFYGAGGFAKGGVKATPAEDRLKFFSAILP
jgi:hypothetical protein